MTAPDFPAFPAPAPTLPTWRALGETLGALVATAGAAKLGFEGPLALALQGLALLAVIDLGLCRLQSIVARASDLAETLARLRRGPGQE